MGDEEPLGAEGPAYAKDYRHTVSLQSTERGRGKRRRNSGHKVGEIKT